MMAVSNEDTIFVSISDLDKQKAQPVDVTWRQGPATATEKYIQTTFKITKTHDGEHKTGAETEGVIFVQLSMVDDFKDKIADEPELTIVLDKDFMYGNISKDGARRWLVYHDKKHTPFQYRFISGAIQAAGNKASDFAKLLGYESVVSLFKDVGKSIGEDLHDF